MSDFALIWNLKTGSADLRVTANDLEKDEGIETAIMLSLFIDRRAEDTDILPEGETDRRGWWADAFPVVEGDKIGSRLWLLKRSKQTPDVLDRADEYVRESLQWMIEDKVTDKIEITDLAFPALGQMTLGGLLYRPGRDSVEFRFNRNWAAQVVKAV